jgi:hypothetical protein
MERLRIRQPVPTPKDFNPPGHLFQGGYAGMRITDSSSADSRVEGASIAEISAAEVMVFQLWAGSCPTLFRLPCPERGRLAGNQSLGIPSGH